MAPLSNLQKREIAIVARRAYDAWSGREAFEAANPELSRTACFEAWRHVQIRAAVHVTESLRECTQAHYGTVLAHFKGLAGDAAGAQRTRVRDADNPRRIARYKLEEALRHAGLQLGYAYAICRTQNKCSLEEASAKQLWRLVFTVKNRRKHFAGQPKPAVVAAAEDQDDENPF